MGISDLLRKSSARPLPLRPFLLRIRGGFLLGVALPPEVGSPCAGCVKRWLADRSVWHEDADLSELRTRRDLIADLIAENSPHAHYEILQDGTVTRLDGVVFPHPQCGCAAKGYAGPEAWDKKTCFAFSPIYRLSAARFGTADGNMWLSHATGSSPLTGQRITTHGAAYDREAARFTAVAEWLKRASTADLERRRRGGEPLSAETLQTEAHEILAELPASAQEPEGCGAGETREAAILDALHGFARARTVRRFAANVKSPMLIVGTNNWIRQKVPFFFLQQYDLHLLFYPNSMPSWVVGLACLSRQSTKKKPFFTFGSAADVGAAVDMALLRALELCRPPAYQFEGEAAPGDPPAEQEDGSPQLHLWWTNWVYRCPKIALKDVLHLAPHGADIGAWREYFRDGQTPLQLLSLNGGHLPSGLRHLVKAYQAPDVVGLHRNVRGIGTGQSFQDAWS